MIFKRELIYIYLIIYSSQVEMQEHACRVRT